MSKLTHLGGAFCTTFICIFLITSNIKFAGAWGTGTNCSFCQSNSGTSLKKKVGRQRPYLIFTNIQVRKPLFDCSFPSGHTTAGYALATMFALDFPFLSFPLLTLATLVGFSRTYLGFHYPLDVFMGAVVGGGTAFTVHHYMPLSFLF